MLQAELARRRAEVAAELARRGIAVAPIPQAKPDPVAFARQCGFEPDPWQQAVLRSTAPALLLNCSRQSGKSQTTALVALYTALYTPGSLVLLVSPGERQSGELFEKLEGAYRACGEPVKAEKHTELQLELENGSRVIALPGKEGTIRGFSGARLLVLDEASRVPDELYYSIRPMLAVSHGRLIALSTPFGKRGWWYEAWQREHPTAGASLGDWECYHVRATECPRISAEFLERERRSLPLLWYASEYQGTFVDAVDQLFGYALVHGALSEELEPLRFEGMDESVLSASVEPLVFEGLV